MSKIEDEVCEIIQQRAKVGLNKYGVTMERDDLERDDWLEHLQHELMDAVVYIQRLRTREETLESKLRQLLEEPEPVSDFNKGDNGRPQCEAKTWHGGPCRMKDYELKDGLCGHHYAMQKNGELKRGRAADPVSPPALRGRFIEEVEQIDTLSAHRKRLSEDTKLAMAKKKADCKVFTGEIFGWDRDADDIVPNWKEQDIIDYMRFRYYEQGWSGNKIAKHFNKLKLKGKRNGAWTSSMVLRTCRYNYHAKRIKFDPPDWWGTEAYHDAVEFGREDD